MTTNNYGFHWGPMRVIRRIIGRRGERTNYVLGIETDHHELRRQPCAAGVCIWRRPFGARMARRNGAHRMNAPMRCEAACPPGHPHVPCVRPFLHEGQHSAEPKWIDLFGAAPDFAGLDDEGGRDRGTWLAGFRAHQGGLPCAHGYGPGDHHWEAGTCLAGAARPINARHTRRPFVYREREGCWWAVLRHSGWEDATAFDTWDDAVDHALVLCARRAARPGGGA